VSGKQQTAFGHWLYFRQKGKKCWKMPDNRRVKMTKRLMKEALIDLMDQKPLEKITVTEICKIADVNRSTF